jgi:hypothetical protein
LSYEAYLRGKEAIVGNSRGLRRLWQPPAEKLEAIAAVLTEHWRAAASHPGQLFWASPVSWVTVRAVRIQARRAPVHHHFTSGGKLIR